MPSQTLIWTALPAGIAGLDDGRQFLRLSVFISPRLTAGQGEGDRLALWPDFLDWPARMRTVRVAVEFAGGPTVEATVDTDELDSRLWKALVRPDTFVRAHRFDDYTGRSVISYPARRVYEAVRGTYQTTAFSAPNGWGGFETESGEPIGFKPWQVPWNAQTEAQARALLSVPASELSGTDVAARALLFHRRPPETPVTLPTSPSGHEETIDFHQALSALGDYPALLRRLGLVLDLRLPVGQVPSGVTAVRILPTFTPAPGAATTVNRTPRTAVTRTATAFHATSKTGEIVDGLLALSDQRYSLVPLDLDGAALKLVNTALMARRHEDDRFGDGPPALRSAGIALVAEDEALRTRLQFNQAKTTDAALAAGGDVTFFAEDLVRGLRVDVWEERTGVWRSLCRRAGTYTFEAIDHTTTVEDEGFVEPAMTEAAAPLPGAPNDLYLHEAVVRWEGWAANVPRPGRTGSVAGDASPQEPDNSALTPFKLRVSMAPVPGSLPGLRFGRRYRLRARIADLAGNSVRLEAAPDVGLPDGPRPFAYLRYEPVAPPLLVPRAPIRSGAPGESVDRLVLRTANTDPDLDDAPSPARAERHVVPARVGVPLAETQGAVDGPDGRPRADRYTLLRDRDAGELPVDPGTGDPVDPAAQSTLPYLPDPLSRGPVLRGLPGAPPNAIGRIDAAGRLVFTDLADAPTRGLLARIFGGSSPRPSAALLDWGTSAQWPRYRPLRLVLRDGAGPPVWDDAARVLTVSLPKGASARVPLSSHLDEDDLRLMGVWEWVREVMEGNLAQILDPVDGDEESRLRLLADRLGASTQLAVEGGHALLTPARRVQLIHAVQQPIGRPTWRRLSAVREPGRPTATFAGELQVNLASTAAVALLAGWDEQVDLPDEPGPRVRRHEDVVVDMSLPAPDERRFNGLAEFDVEAGGATVARYVPATDSLIFGPTATPRHGLDDTRHRLIRYRAVSTSRYREFFPADAKGGFTRASDEHPIRLPSTVRPAPPRVAYLMPTFAWERQHSTNLMTSRRIGNGLRCYLDRPWFSSGDGELLGVVLRGSGPATDEALRSLVSQAGNDPIVVGTGDASLTTAGFRTGVIASGLALDGLPAGNTVTVVGLPVHYDEARQQWYCDLELDLDGSYDSPTERVDAWSGFLRLSLVRYQPNALPGRELSRPVICDFAQVAPDRFGIATLDPYERGTVRLTVSGSGPRTRADALGTARPATTSVEVTVQRRLPHIDGDLGWGPVPGSVATVERDVTPPAGDPQALWAGRIELPADRRPGEYRVVIREFESWLDDASVAAGGINPADPARRLIFAETLVLA